MSHQNHNSSTIILKPSRPLFRPIVAMFWFCLAFISAPLNAQADEVTTESTRELEEARDNWREEAQEYINAFNNLETVIEVLEDIESLPFLDEAFDDIIELLEESQDWFEEAAQRSIDNANEYNSQIPENWA